MANSTTIHGPIILRDGLPVGQDHNPFTFLLRTQGQSVDYALSEGGYSIESNDALVRGWMEYLTIKARRGYGADGTVIRLIEELDYLSNFNGGIYREDYVMQGEVVRPLVDAIRTLLNYTDGALSNVNGKLDEAVMTLAARFGITEA